ncbi:cupin domain-containing protein [Vibrio marisflavi]|uniref:Cupin type-2 domain-containing protein n=1 Tax=Vibrio marisflavi CECT 7928 TaxID=634439 RepID=A0ABN8DYA8_9VIBR|nr:cupin domain-containing protein [Vibrio marisflavi]CAH0536507.1 hypothetical protein VMF7928_00457 [Vibrio marisflavi CECT 7928]
MDIKNLFFVLAISIGLTSGAYAQGEHEHGKAQVKVLAKSTKSWDGSTLPKYGQGQPEVQVLKITIPAGAKLPMHKHPVINAGYLMKGELEVTTEQGEKKTIKAGDALIEVTNKWHYGRNIGNEPAEIIVVYASTEGSPITVLK